MKQVLREVCLRETDLGEEEIRILEEVERGLPMIAELTNSDIFIDCFVSGDRAVVAAHAAPDQPEEELLYSSPVVGQYATPEREPAVFRCRELGAPVRDIRAITQEEQTVRQSVAPVWGPRKNVIGVLIREEDISYKLRKEKKYQELARTVQTAGMPGMTGSAANAGAAQGLPGAAGIPSPWEEEVLMLREVNHRIKNQLQLVASILNIQARRAKDGEAADLLRENSARVSALAANHDIIAHSRNFDTVNMDELLKQLLQNLQILVPEGKEIRMELHCPSCQINGEHSVRIMV